MVCRQWQSWNHLNATDSLNFLASDFSFSLHCIPSNGLPPKLTKLLLWQQGRVTLKPFLGWEGLTSVTSTHYHHCIFNGYFRALLFVLVEESYWNKQKETCMTESKFTPNQYCLNKSLYIYTQTFIWLLYNHRFKRRHIQWITLQFLLNYTMDYIPRKFQTKEKGSFVLWISRKVRGLWSWNSFDILPSVYAR